MPPPGQRACVPGLGPLGRVPAVSEGATPSSASDPWVRGPSPWELGAPGQSEPAA